MRRLAAIEQEFAAAEGAVASHVRITAPEDIGSSLLAPLLATWAVVRIIAVKKSSLIRLINYWPPYLGSGIKVRHISKDMRSIDVEMALRFWNRNYVGVHFGGSLYAMTDPFFMLMVMENLGRDYIVWDKAASIRFKKPGKGRVTAQFRLSDAELAAIKQAADTSSKTEPTFEINVVDESGDVVAEVVKTIYVRRKDREKPNEQAVDPS